MSTANSLPSNLLFFFPATPVCTLGGASLIKFFQGQEVTVPKCHNTTLQTTLEVCFPISQAWSM